ncbi:MAG: glycosyltransferase N-terminal domain-containing protein, partial [Candidatus Omnitrophota bacterium]|nr:glycosyltransferase N-terminal domain-containing protein [Candidatus Omnitrophota bacterium]
FGLLVLQVALGHRFGKKQTWSRVGSLTTSEWQTLRASSRLEIFLIVINALISQFINTIFFVYTLGVVLPQVYAAINTTGFIVGLAIGALLFGTWGKIAREKFNRHHLFGMLIGGAVVVLTLLDMGLAMGTGSGLLSAVMAGFHSPRISLALFLAGLVIVQSIIQKTVIDVLNTDAQRKDDLSLIMTKYGYIFGVAAHWVVFLTLRGVDQAGASQVLPGFLAVMAHDAGRLPWTEIGQNLLNPWLWGLALIFATVWLIAYRLYQHLPYWTITIIRSTTSFWAIVWSVSILGSHPTVLQVIASLLLMAGAVIMVWRTIVNGRNGPRPVEREPGIVPNGVNGVSNGNGMKKRSGLMMTMLNATFRPFVRWLIRTSFNSRMFKSDSRKAKAVKRVTYASLSLVRAARNFVNHDIQARDFAARYNVFPPEIETQLAAPGRSIVIVAIGEGEVINAVKLSRELRKITPDKIVLITFFPAKVRSLPIMKDSGLIVLPYPAELRYFIDRWLKMVRPRLIILQEIFSRTSPYLLKKAKTDYRAGILLINSYRTEDAEHQGLIGLHGLEDRFFGKEKIALIDEFGVVSSEASEYFVHQGVSPERISVIHNIKFDAADVVVTDQEKADIRRSLGIGPEDPVVVFGSVRAGEEAILTAAYQALIRQPGLERTRLIFAPRMMLNAAAFGGYLARKGLSVSKRSAGPNGHSQVILLDTMGELRKIYCVADVVVVAGSFIPERGGHNPMEPANFGKPVIVGPYTADFADVIAIFKEKDAILQLASPDNLTDELIRLMKDKEAARALGERARRVMDEHRGSVQKYVEMAQRHLNGKEEDHPIRSAAMYQQILLAVGHGQFELARAYGVVFHALRILEGSGQINGPPGFENVVAYHTSDGAVHYNLTREQARPILHAAGFSDEQIDFVFDQIEIHENQPTERLAIRAQTRVIDEWLSLNNGRFPYPFHPAPLKTRQPAENRILWEVPLGLKPEDRDMIAQAIARGETDAEVSMANQLMGERFRGVLGAIAECFTRLESLTDPAAANVPLDIREWRNDLRVVEMAPDFCAAAFHAVMMRNSLIQLPVAMASAATMREFGFPDEHKLTVIKLLSLIAVHLAELGGSSRGPLQKASWQETERLQAAGPDGPAAELETFRQPPWSVEKRADGVFARIHRGQGHDDLASLGAVVLENGKIMVRASVNFGCAGGKCDDHAGRTLVLAWEPGERVLKFWALPYVMSSWGEVPVAVIPCASCPVVTFQEKEESGITALTVILADDIYEALKPALMSSASWQDSPAHFARSGLGLRIGSARQFFRDNLIEAMSGKQVAWKDPGEQNVSASSREIRLDATPLPAEGSQWMAPPRNAMLPATVKIHVFPSEQELASYPDLSKLYDCSLGKISLEGTFGQLSGGF